MLDRIVKLALMLAFAALMATPPAQSTAMPVSSNPAPLDSIARTPEVKLRKLHLVRPDLIPFPIFFEVYC